MSERPDDDELRSRFWRTGMSLCPVCNSAANLNKDRVADDDAADERGFEQFSCAPCSWTARFRFFFDDAAVGAGAGGDDDDDDGGGGDDDDDDDDDDAVTVMEVDES